MARTITIHQPDFFPWLGFFDRWAKSDLFVVMDNVQYLRRGWHNRDQIKSTSGPIWLTVPVVQKGRYDQEIRDVELDTTSNWRRKHLNTIRACYSKAPQFKSLFPLLEDIYGQRHERLMDFNMDILALCSEQLGITTPMKLASSLPTTEVKTRRLVDLCRQEKASHYLTGTGSRSYLKEELFHAEGIEVVWQQYEQPEYPQLHGEFTPMLSTLDYLMMCSPQQG